MIDGWRFQTPKNKTHASATYKIKLIATEKLPYILELFTPTLITNAICQLVVGEWNAIPR